MLHEIDIAAAMREHLAETSPELITATSFLDAVGGRTYAPIRRKASRSMATGVGERGTMGTSSHTAVPFSKVITGHGGLATGGERRGGGDVESDSDREMTDVVVLGDKCQRERRQTMNLGRVPARAVVLIAQAIVVRVANVRQRIPSNGNPKELSDDLFPVRRIGEKGAVAYIYQHAKWPNARQRMK